MRNRAPFAHAVLHGPSSSERDEIGLELSGLDAVYLDVCRTILDVSADLARSGHDPMPYAFEIAAAGGVLLMVVPFCEMLSKGPQGGRYRLPLSTARQRAEMIRATVLRAEVSESIDRLSETIRMSRQIVAPSRASGAADPWGGPPRQASLAS